MGSIFGGAPVPVSGTARSADPPVRRPLRDLAGRILASCRWHLPAFRHVASGAEMHAIQVEAQRNVAQRHREREASPDSLSRATARASFLAGGPVPGGVARSCAGMPGASAFERQADIDAEVYAEINRIVWRRGLVPEVKL